MRPVLRVDGIFQDNLHTQEVKTYKDVLNIHNMPGTALGLVVKDE